VRVILAPDRLPDLLTATQVAEAMAEGWRRAAPRDAVTLVPLGDGGIGLVESVAAVAGGELVAVAGASGAPGVADTGWPVVALVVNDLPGRPGRTVVLEAAQVLGSASVGAGRSPDSVPSTAFGDLLDAVLALDPDRLVVGVGGVLSHDAGLGALAALGLAGPAATLRSGGHALAALTTDDLDGLAAIVARFADVEIEVAVDTDVPLLGLHGASASLGLATPVLAAPVTAGAAQDLERAFGHASQVIGRVLGPGAVRAAAAQPGAGAGGGLAFALALLGGRLSPGAELLAGVSGLGSLVSGAGGAAPCDLLVTGGRSLDPHALHGSAVSVVAEIGQSTGVPVVVISQEVVLGRREWSAAGIAGAYAVADDLDALDRAVADPYGSLVSRSERVARTWSR